MDIKYKKVIARSLAKTIKVIDFTPAGAIDTNQENRDLLEARSKAMEAIFSLGLDLTQNYKIRKRGSHANT